VSVADFDDQKPKDDGVDSSEETRSRNGDSCCSRRKRLISLEVGRERRKRANQLPGLVS